MVKYRVNGKLVTKKEFDKHSRTPDYEKGECPGFFMDADWYRENGGRGRVSMQLSDPRKGKYVYARNPGELEDKAKRLGHVVEK